MANEPVKVLLGKETSGFTSTETIKAGEDCGIFIDLLESNPCLWNPVNRDYKDMNRKLAAQINIADAMGTGWTGGMLQ